MNPSEFESELKAIRPAAMSPERVDAIARELAQPAAPTAAVIHRREQRGSILRQLLSGLCWAGAGAALAVLSMHAMGQHNPPAQTPEPAEAATDYFEPAETSRRLLSAEASELVMAPDQEPTRIVRYSSTERHVWANPATGARVEVEVPREDVMLMPVSFQ